MSQKTALTVVIDDRRLAATPLNGVGSDNVCYSNSSESDSESVPDVPKVGLRGSRHRHYTFAEKLAARVVCGPSCWLVNGHALPNGYVQIASGSAATGNLVRKFAHRLAYEIAFGPIPSGCVVLHTCDTPRCVNPAHLRVGTQADNIADAISKGRYTAWHKTGVKLDGTKAKRRSHVRQCAPVRSRSASPTFGL